MKTVDLQSAGKLGGYDQRHRGKGVVGGGGRTISRPTSCHFSNDLESKSMKSVICGYNYNCTLLLPSTLLGV